MCPLLTCLLGLLSSLYAEMLALAVRGYSPTVAEMWARENGKTPGTKKKLPAAAVLRKG